MCGKYLKGPFHNVTGAPGVAMPLMGAFFLKQLDDRMERIGLFYVRFMDDILLLSPTRRRLRKAVKAVNQVRIDIVCNIFNIPVISSILITYELLNFNSYFIAYLNYKIDPLWSQAYTTAGQHSTSPGCPTAHDLRSTRTHLVICALHLDSQSKNILAKPECDCNMHG